MNPQRRVFIDPRSQVESLTEQETTQFPRSRLIGIWRSPLERAVRRHGPPRASSRDWKNFIANLSNSGVSNDEIDLCGILRMLEWDDPDRVMHREEILDFIDEVGIKIHVMQERGWTMGRPWFAFNTDEDPPNRYQTTFRTDEIGTRYGFQIEPAGLFDPDRLKGRWVARFRRPGTDEVSLVLSAGDPASAVEWCHGVAWRRGYIGPGRIGRYRDESLTGGRNYREILFVVPNAWPPFDPAHFPVQNVLCHLRLVDRLSEDGARLLHIEEIQSDILNPRRYPFKPPLKNQWVKIALSWCLQEALERNMAGVSLSGANIHLNRNSETRAPGLRDFYNRVEKTLFSLGSRTGGIQSRAVYRCHEPNLNAYRKAGGWAIVSRRGGIILGGIPTREEAEAIRDAWLPDDPIAVPALRFTEEHEPTWAVPFFRLDPDEKPQRRQQTAMSDRGREALELLDYIDQQVVDALVGLGCEYFGSITESMIRVEDAVKDQEVLPDAIAQEFLAYADQVRRDRGNWQDRRPAGDSLNRMRKTVVALREVIREQGDIPANWLVIRPQRPGSPRITPDCIQESDSSKSLAGGKREQGVEDHEV